VSAPENEEAYARAVDDAVTRALAEDLGPDGDLTAALVDENVTALYALRARQRGVLAGRACAAAAFDRIDPGIEVAWHAADGDEVKPGDTIADVAGPLRPILTAERTALNFLGHLSGVATLTARYVAAAH
jgi:nicotinate-nucleotide pyrophosphorylase (carboxylating)